MSKIAITPNMGHCVYWIHKEEHTDMFCEGYVGVSCDVERRLQEHLNYSQNPHLKRAIEKYGWDNLVKTVLVIAEKDYCLSVERKLRPEDKIGWNIVAGGGAPPVIRGPRPELRGRQPWNKGKTGIYSEETLEIMRQKRIGVAPANKGVPLTEEHKEILRQKNLGNAYRKGKKMPREAVERIAAKNRGRVQSKEERAMRSRALKGIKKTAPRSDEHKRKLGLNSKGKHWYNDGNVSVFCFVEDKPDGFSVGRLTPWMSKKGNEN